MDLNESIWLAINATRRSHCGRYFALDSGGGRQISAIAIAQSLCMPLGVIKKQLHELRKDGLVYRRANKNFYLTESGMSRANALEKMLAAPRDVREAPSASGVVSLNAPDPVALWNSGCRIGDLLEIMRINGWSAARAKAALVDAALDRRLSRPFPIDLAKKALRFVMNPDLERDLDEWMKTMTDACRVQTSFIRSSKLF